MPGTRMSATHDSGAVASTGTTRSLPAQRTRRRVASERRARSAYAATTHERAPCQSAQAAARCRRALPADGLAVAGFPIGAFAYSRGLEWAVEAGDIATPQRCRTGSRRCSATAAGVAMPCSSRMRIAPRQRRRRSGRCRSRRACAPRSRRRRSAISRPPRRAAPSSMRRARPGRARRSTLLTALRGEVALSGGGRRGLRRPWHPAGAGARRLSAGVRRQPDLGRRAARAARPDRRPARPGRAGAGGRRSCAARALATPLDDVGGAAFRADLASMRHETQYTRLFRS